MRIRIFSIKQILLFSDRLKEKVIIIMKCELEDLDRD
jgi:hypothetical protein